MKKIASVVMTVVLALGACAAAKETSAFGTAFQGLAGDDQAAFVREVNQSMAKSDQPLDAKRIETLYRVNRDAVKAASEADRKTVLAEVFATAPLAALPRIVEGFAKELFSRSAGGFRTDDDSFVEFVAAALLRIRGRCQRAGIENYPGARTTFAVIMFLKASEGKPADLRQQLLQFVPSGSYELARTVWIPEAMGDNGQAVSYTSILEAGEKGEEPAHANAHPMAMHELGNLQVGSNLRTTNAKDVSSPLTRLAEDSVSILPTVPRGSVDSPDSPWYRRRRGEDGYSGQVTH